MLYCWLIREPPTRGGERERERERERESERERICTINRGEKFII